MPLPVIAYVAYLTRNHTGAQAEYHAHKFVQALKDHSINGFAWVPVLGALRKLETHNRADAIRWFAEVAAPQIAARVDPPRVFVPIPNSVCVEGVPHSSTARFARALLPYVGGVLWDGLRWHEANVPSSQGGPRDPETLHDNLRAVRRPIAGRCVLVDDVITSGAHFRAAAARLKSMGMAPVLGVAASHTVHAPTSEPFGWVDHTVEDFVASKSRTRS